MLPRLVLAVLLVIWTSLIIVTTASAGGCGYESCPKTKEGYLNIHLVPHSHDDVGWLKTVDQYYYGDKNGIQLASVQYILDSVVSELQKSPDRRFIYVESGFFWRWWTNQDPATQTIVRNLVNTGQLEFINGGWCMNDEATAHYNAIIDQMSLGLRYLNDTFGECALPRVAWQIDPFGHSREQASLFAGMGFDGLFFGRLDYQDKYQRRLDKTMETIWSGSPTNLGEDANLFTGVLFNGYNPPDGYCFDIFCGDDPINDDPKLLDYNLDTKVEDFISVSKYWGTPYRTKHVQMTMGSDFQYMAAHTWYKNLDKLIKHVNARQANGSMVNLIYSTPSCYLQEVNKANLTWPTKTDDFFPYASDPHAFWTGYFTSRPTLKYFVHKTNNFFQVCQQLGAMTDENGETFDDIFNLAEPMGVAQHHDAVSGTAKQHVTNDYARRLSIGIKSCENVISSALRKIEASSRISISAPSSSSSSSSGDGYENIVVANDGKVNSYKFCHQLNISQCDTSEMFSTFVLGVYNPLAWTVQNSYIKLPVSTPTWHVQDSSGAYIASQAIPLPLAVMDIPGRQSSAEYELVFPAGNLPGLSLTNFKLTRVIDNSNEIVHPKFQPIVQHLRTNVVELDRSRYEATPILNSETRSADDFILENSVGLSVTFDGDTGLIKCLRRGESEMKFTQNFFYYQGMVGNNTEFAYRASGAYIFRPNGTSPIPIALKANYTVYRGQHVLEVHQVFSNWVSQVVRLYDKADSLEFEWLVGPIPVWDKVGKEVISRYTADLETNGVFFTDSNGREMLKRQRNSRPTWHYKVYEPIAGNYYPVNSRMILKDRKNSDDDVDGKHLILLNDRAQGGTSLNDGEIEMMIHRRLLHDDAFGVGEALNEIAYGAGLVARGRHWIVFAGEKTGVPTSIHRRLAQEIFMDRIFTFRNSMDTDASDDNGSDSPCTTTLYSKLSQVLPSNCHLLTLRKLAVNEYLIRFEHFYERAEDKDLSNDISISVQELQKVLHFKSLRETTLGANQWKDEAKRLRWQTQQNSTRMNNNYGVGDNPLVITLTPMQIRTYVFTT